MDQIEEVVHRRMEMHYTTLYRDMLGLRDHVARTEKRFAEDEGSHFATAMDDIELYTGSVEGKEVLLVGCGTGGEAMFLAKERNCSAILGVEPETKALEITRLKCKQHNRNPEDFISGTGENIPFQNNRFELVICHTVLEHVDDPKKTIDEMIRVTRPGGDIYIRTPNYMYPHEGHYKIRCYPPALPLGRILFRLTLMWKRRPKKYASTLNFFSHTTLRRHLAVHVRSGVISFAYIEPIDVNRTNRRGYIGRTGVYNMQRIVIKKRNGK